VLELVHPNLLYGLTKVREQCIVVASVFDKNVEKVQK
jgi:hypothetical protein